MKQLNAPFDFSEDTLLEEVQPLENHLEYQREILKYITDIGTSLRIQMDTDVLLKRISTAACKALRFRHAVLYLHDDAGYFRVSASSGISDEDKAYLRQHPLPENIVAQLISNQYRMSDSYFVPAEAPIWQNEEVNSFFVVVDDYDAAGNVVKYDPPTSAASWRPEDLMLVPLTSDNNALLGFLTPDAPFDGLRPTVETMSILELFANQAAVAIEGARLYEEARRNSEERAALIEIGRALSSPEALRDVQTVYQIIYEQVRRVMTADVFFVARYSQMKHELLIDYLMDNGVFYPSFTYPSIPPKVEKFLREEKVGYLFSTLEEYLTCSGIHAAELDEDLIGQKLPSQSSIFVPIHFSDDAIGLISAQCYQPHAYTRRHLKMLKEIAVQAGIAITNARLYTSLHSALQQAQESERLKNHFLMTASHELRTPLTAVQGYIELLHTFSPVLDEEAKMRFVGSARRACEELVLLLGNVMDTSRIDQDRVSLNIEAVHVIKTVNMILEILEPTIISERRAVDVHVPDDLYVRADDLRLRQILLNLTGNALKYTPPASNIAITAGVIDNEELRRRITSTSVQVQVTVPPMEHYAFIAIRDRGPGICKADQSRLFTKFMRLDSAMNSMQRGAGLGLYLCRQLTEAMDGQIWVESDGIAGQGTTFCIALPLHTNTKDR